MMISTVNILRFEFDIPSSFKRRTSDSDQIQFNIIVEDSVCQSTSSSQWGGWAAGFNASFLTSNTSASDISMRHTTKNLSQHSTISMKNVLQQISAHISGTLSILSISAGRINNYTDKVEVFAMMFIELFDGTIVLHAISFNSLDVYKRQAIPIVGLAIPQALAVIIP